MKPGDKLSPVLGTEQLHPPSQRSSQETTPISLIHRLTLKSLKGYSSLIKAKQQSSLQSEEDQGGEREEVRGREREGGRGWTRESGREDRKPLPKKEVAGKESLYTFYTSDDDLVAKGKKMYSSATLATLATLTGSFGDTCDSRPSRRRLLWDPENIDVRRSRVKDPRVVSEVYRQLILHPNHYYESEVVRQWMLERCGPDPRSCDRGGRGIADKVDGSGGGHGITDAGRERDTLKYNWPPTHLTTGGDSGRGIHEEYYYRYYKLATTTSSHPQMLYNPLCAEGGGAGRESGREYKVHHTTPTRPLHKPLYEWSQVYPIVKKPEGMMVVDKSRQGFQSKPHPLPPIDTALSADHVTHTGGHHMTHTHGHHVRIVRIKLPKLQV